LPGAVFILLFLIPAESFPGNKVRTIVVFFPLNANLPAYQNLLEGYRSAFPQDYDEPYDLLIEYLDLGRLPDEDYARHMVGLYNERLKNTRIDLLITIPANAYQVLKKYGLDALKNTPTIKLDFDQPAGNLPDSLLTEKTLEIRMKIDVRKTFTNAFALFPHNRDVYVISGNTKTDQYFTSLVSLAANSFKETHRFIFVSGISLDSTILVARKIPAGSIVIIPIFLSDNKNTPFSTPEAIGIIANQCSAPVFPIFDSFIVLHSHHGPRLL